MTSTRPDLRPYFRARIDYHVNGMLARTSAHLPHEVSRITGDVTDAVITATMLDGSVDTWSGGRYASRRVNLCYAPLMPRPS
jgi:hypothetical protein